MGNVSAAECWSVLACYRRAVGERVPDPLVLTPVSGGFSGAEVWCVTAGERRWCLRRWPDDPLPLPRLRELHRWLEWLHTEGGVPVAVPVPANDGRTVIESAGRVWQLEPWLPGVADFHSHPTVARLAQVMLVLARLHRCSARYETTAEGRAWFARGHGPSPAVAERLHLLEQWPIAAVEATSRRLQALPSTPLTQLAQETLLLAAQRGEQVRRELLAARGVEVPLFPCLRDVWHDHVLWTGDSVTGVIDPSAARRESAAADLSRLLMSLLGPDGPRQREALEMYAIVRPLTDNERRLMLPLTLSGAVLSGLYWVERIASGELPHPPGRVEARLRRIVDHLRDLP
jgi:Ser/Thr protein kinase RdoA (MazF antagonist)